MQSDVESARPSASGKMTTRPSNIDPMASEKSEEGEYSVKCTMNLKTNNQMGSSQVRSCKCRERIRPSAQAVEGFHKNKIEGYYNTDQDSDGKDAAGSETEREEQQCGG